MKSITVLERIFIMLGDELKIRTPFGKKLAAWIIEILVKKNLGESVKINFNTIDLDHSEGDNIKIHVDVEVKTSEDSVKNLIKNNL